VKKDGKKESTTKKIEKRKEKGIDRSIDLKRLEGLGTFASLLGLGREQFGMDIRKHTALGNDDASKELVELFIVADSKLKMTRDDARLLVVAGRRRRQKEKSARSLSDEIRV